MRDVSLMSRLQLRAICLMLRVPAFWTSSLAAWWMNDKNKWLGSLMAIGNKWFCLLRKSELYTPPSSNFSEQIWVQKLWQAHVSAMNRVAWYRFAQKIRRFLVETANINLILFFCLLDGVHFTTQSLVFRGLTINTNPTLHYSGLTCSSCSQ